LGNWKRGENWTVPSFIDYKKLFYKEEQPDIYPFHVAENTIIYFCR